MPLNLFGLILKNFEFFYSLFLSLFSGYTLPQIVKKFPLFQNRRHIEFSNFLQKMKKYQNTRVHRKSSASEERILRIFAKHAQSGEPDSYNYFGIKGFLAFYTRAATDRMDHVMSDIKVYTPEAGFTCQRRKSQFTALMTNNLEEKSLFQAAYALETKTKLPEVPL